MYFSPLVKQELARIIPAKKWEQMSELIAFLIMNGRVENQGKLLIIIDNPATVKVVYFLLKRVFQHEAKIDVVNKYKKRKIYRIIVADFFKVDLILKKLDLVKNNRGEILKNDSADCKNLPINKNFSAKSFLCGAFLAGGFVNDPERMYHLEIACPSKEIARLVKRILTQSSFFAKVSFWQKKWTVYIKKNDQIFEFLRFIGVQRALLNFQDIIARKDILNTVNRLVNCDTANLDKTIASASKQLFYIDLVVKRIGLENLPPNLRDVVNARLDHPYASIQELAEILGGGITKSGIFHRLKKIEQMADY